MILIPSVIIITLLSLVFFIGFGDATAQDIATNDTSTLLEKGIALQRLGQYNESIGYYDMALAIDPNNVNALHNKGFALYNLGKYLFYKILFN